MRIAVIYRELFLLLLTITTCLNAPTNGHNKSYWYEKNRKLIRERMRSLHADYLPRVKNVVIFIGDGMGMTTITASRVFKRQDTGNPNARLTFDDFPATALVQTDIANSQIPESAASSTALFCGVKTNFENLGVDITATGKDACKNINSHTPSVISWAQEKNLKTGFVTTTRVTHATPAALYAHSRRHVEDDSRVDMLGCKDIARQLIEDRTGRNLNVVMGGGMRSFVAEKEDGSGGKRKDGKNLTAEWLALHPNGEFVTNYYEMMNISEKAEHVLGVFANSHMHFNADRDAEVEPSIAEMTQTAINILRRNNSNGFLLVVEGGKIDLAHHYNNAYRALDDTLALDKAIAVAVKTLDLSESLIIVTSDHSSAMSYSGFATPIGQNILGMDKFNSNIDGRPYQILTYSSGIGHKNYSEKLAIEDYHNAHHKATIPSTWANHGAEDVPLYAIGSMSSLLFGGTFDQTYVPHAVAYAMCLFEYESRCVQEPPQQEKQLRGIDALKKELSRENEHKITFRESEVEETLSLTEVFAEASTENATLAELYESSDLVSNLTANGNSSCNALYSRSIVAGVMTLLSINLLLI